MAKRVFISFAAKDSNYRDFLRGQARNEKSPFEFVDMSVKEPWDSDWKRKCRTKITGCNGVIVLVSRKTHSASGARWEMKCANEESIPMRGVYVSADDRGNVITPAELANKRIVYCLGGHPKPANSGHLKTGQR